MECMSCNAAINPKWKHAIENNSCPCCGEKIMEEALKDLLSTLTTTINLFKEKFEKQLNHWLLYNFDYIKTDNPEIINFIPKSMLPIVSVESSASPPPAIVNHESSNSNDNGLIKKVNDAEVNKFFKNADVDKVVKRSGELKELVQKIRGDNQISNVSVNMASEEVDMPEDFDSSMVDAPYDNSDDIPAAVLAFANQNKQDPTYNAKDALHLQRMQDRVRASRSNMINGTGGKGSFSRSG